MSARRSVKKDPPSDQIDVGLAARLTEAEHLIGMLRGRTFDLAATLLMRENQVAELEHKVAELASELDELKTAAEDAEQGEDVESTS